MSLPILYIRNEVASILGSSVDAFPEFPSVKLISKLMSSAIARHKREIPLYLRSYSFIFEMLIVFTRYIIVHLVLKKRDQSEIAVLHVRRRQYKNIKE